MGTGYFGGDRRELRSVKFNAKMDFMRAELTLKQQRFVTEYLATGNATEAARRAGYKGNNRTLQVVGSENLSKPIIRKVIGNQLDILKPEEVLQNLTRIANSSVQFKGSDVVKANELIGKHHKLFDNKSADPETACDTVELMADLAVLLVEIRDSPGFQERLRKRLEQQERLKSLEQRAIDA